MLEIFEQFNPIVRTLIGTGFTCFMTALGATIVFFAKDLPPKAMDGMLGFAVTMTLDVALS